MNVQHPISPHSWSIGCQDDQCREQKKEIIDQQAYMMHDYQKEAFTFTIV